MRRGGAGTGAAGAFGRTGAEGCGGTAGSTGAPGPGGAALLFGECVTADPPWSSVAASIPSRTGIRTGLHWILIRSRRGRPAAPTTNAPHHPLPMNTRPGPVRFPRAAAVTRPGRARHA
nr:hypothetical protein StreXyl84_42080 [Streptomyces sp. Xyl84]